MIKNVLIVPKGIRYISEWKEFSLPNYPIILDKKLTGCGFTEYCIGSDENTIICSPRVILLENKESQHQGELFYVKNDLESVLNIDASDKEMMSDNSDDIASIIKEKAKESGLDTDSETASYYRSLRSNILHYYLHRQSQGLPCKFIVTYDSFRHVKEALIEGGVLEEFRVVIDEFQSIFTDSRFKSTTEIGFLKQLGGVSRVCFVSATPMLDKYLEMLDEFKDLPYYELDWKTEDPGRVISPQLIARPCASILTAVKPIIEGYLSGVFEKFTYRDDSEKIQEIASKELVIYVNSVKNICDIIRKFELTLENTNVLCSRTTENRKKVKKAFGAKGKVNVLGTVPKRGEPHKMFTLCTRTVYLGADFYSKCARTVVLSDSNVDSLAVDISLDLPQILGRQRLDENPWKNRAEFFFKVTKQSSKMTKEDFDKLVEKKYHDSESLLNTFYGIASEDQEVLAKIYEKATKVSRYSDSYVSVDIKTGTKYPVINKLVMVAEQRAFDVQQIDYKDRFTVYNALSREGNANSLLRIESYISQFEVLKTFPEKLKYLCDTIESGKLGLMDQDLLLSQVPIDYRNFIQIFGVERLKSFSYRKYLIQEEYEKVYSSQQSEGKLQDIIYDVFEVGKRYKKSEIKDKLGEIYKSLGIKETPKANILGQYFDIKAILINDPITKKRDSGFEIVKKKK